MMDDEQISDTVLNSESDVNANGEFVLAESLVTDELQPKIAEAEPIWIQVWRAISGGRYQAHDAAFIRRINQLSEAIENAPEAPANYIIRGELYLNARLYEPARDDFQQAAELAAIQFERSDWGFMSQAIRDRALIGLAKTEKQLSSFELKKKDLP